MKITRVEEEVGSFTPYIAVADERSEYCRITFAPTPDGLVCVTVHVVGSDIPPGVLEEVTPDQQAPGFFLAPDDELSITDAGLFVAMRRELLASSLRMHVGCSLELPAEYVAPIRQAIQSARNEAAIKNTAHGISTAE